MSQVQYRKAIANESNSIAEFQIAMALETEGFHLDRETCRRGVRVVFDNPALGMYFVFREGPVLLGSLLITYEWSDWRNGVVWWIHSVYVRPEHRGRGVFSGAYHYIKALTEVDPAIRGLRLYVEKKNKRAQSVYAQLGMRNHHYELFEWMKTF